MLQNQTIFSPFFACKHLFSLYNGSGAPMYSALRAFAHFLYRLADSAKKSFSYCI